MDALEALMTRASPAKLGGPGPDRATLDRMLAAAVLAPDHGRLQPWRFIVIEGAGRDAFGKVMADSLKRRDPKADESRMAMESAKAQRAPIIVVVATTPKAHPKIPEIEQVEATAAAVQNLTLAAHACGYGSFWRTGDTAYDPDVKAALGLAAADTIVGFVYIGSVVAPGIRKPVEAAPSVVSWP